MPNFLKSGLSPAQAAAMEIVPGAHPWRGVVLHHSETKDRATNDWDAIRAYHTSYRVDYQIVSREEFERRKAAGQGTKFEPAGVDIGYHFGVEYVDGAFGIRQGRALTIDGAHAVGFNQTHLGVCFVGAYDMAPPHPDMVDMGLRLVRTLGNVFGFPAGDVLGHRETYGRLGKPVAKTCPGRSFNMDAFRAAL